VSLPEEHLSALPSHIATHEDRIRRLRRVIDLANREIGMHERVIVLAQDEGILNLLSAVVDDPKAASAAAADPRSFAASRDVALPDDFDVHIEVDGATIIMTGRLNDDIFPVEVTWDRDRGFVGRMRDLAPRDDEEYLAQSQTG
jgi:hypothetical protein